MENASNEIDHNLAGIQDIQDAFEQFMSDFQIFKETNEQRLSELASQGSSDPLIDEKMQRIERRLDSQEDWLRKKARPALESNFGPDKETKTAMEAYIRRGKTEGYDALQQKGMSVGSEADGGYLVPEQTERRILQALKAESPMRELAASLTISTSLYKRPFAVSGAGAGWVAETGLRSETTTPQLVEMAFPAMELYASPAATKQLLDDSVVDVENWISDEIHTAFGEQESSAFISGDGIAKPKGILDYPRQPASTASFGQIGTVTTGVDGGFDPDAPADSLMDLVHSLNAKYRRNGSFLMNRTTLSAARRLRNENGDYLWQAKLGERLETSLLGFPIAECDDMPDIAPGAPAIAFGDFKRAYLIVDRQGIQILRDPYSSKPYVLFYATKRVGGGMMDFNALRLLTFS